MEGGRCRLIEITDAWVVEALSHAGAAQPGEVRQAASAMPPEVQAAIDARIQGEAFDAAAERAARAQHWR